MYLLAPLSLKGKVSEIEWQTRVDLAACYRLVADMRWGDLIYTHISAKVPGTDHYLVNAFGLGFDEVTASNLVKVDLDGNILDDSPYQINPAGFTIHSAIHEVRHDAMCVIHLHTLATISVASVKGGLKPWSQYSVGDAFMRFYDLQRDCEIQLALMQSNEEIIDIPQPIIDGIYQQASVVHSGETGGQKAWPAMLRKAYKLDPGFCE